MVPVGQNDLESPVSMLFTHQLLVLQLCGTGPSWLVLSVPFPNQRLFLTLSAAQQCASTEVLLVLF